METPWRPSGLYGTYTDTTFIGPPFDPELWRQFLGDRGVDVETLVAAEPLPLGLINATYRLDSASGSWFLRWYRKRELDSVIAELDVVARLERAGFPTPGPIQSSVGAPAEEVLGWAACLFPFVDGQHVEGASDVAVDAAALRRDVGRAAGLLGSTTIGWSFSAPRPLAPCEAVKRYIRQTGQDDQLMALNGMTNFLGAAAEVVRAYEAMPLNELSTGIVHNDLHESNLLVDDAGRLRWVLDFDDAMEAPLVFELVATLPYWAQATRGTLDPTAINDLVDAYDQVRALDAAEREVVEHAALLHQAAEAAGYLNANQAYLRAGTRGLDYCGSLTLFNWMLENPSWRRPLSHAAPPSTATPRPAPTRDQ